LGRKKGKHNKGEEEIFPITEREREREREREKNAAGLFNHNKSDIQTPLRNSTNWETKKILRKSVQTTSNIQLFGRLDYIILRLQMSLPMFAAFSCVTM